VDPKNERARAQDVAAARAAVAALPKAGPSADELLAERIIKADELITAKKFVLARPILEEVLQSAPNNARALFGLAQAIENIPDTVETAADSSEEDRSAAQAERLERAVNMYQQAALNAGTRELWIASWSHVYAGRILDFLELRAEAIAEYDAAKKIGDVPGGGFTEASRGLAQPYTP
jgi:tetratricopeptide (TPR) repeat protein